MKKSLSAIKKFVEQLIRRYKEIVKAIWLIKEEKEHTLIILIDDTDRLDETSVNRLKVDAADLAMTVSKEKKIKIDVNFYLLTDYWELLRHGSPVTFAEIREGIPVYDPSGFFIPLKKLLSQGRIPGTKEAMRTLLEEAPIKLLRIERLYTARIIEELSNACIDAGQAPLLMIGVAPPVPREVGKKLKIHFVDKGMLEAEYVRYCDDMVKLAKQIEHGEKKKIEGKDIEAALDKTARFVERMEKLMEKLTKEA
ncbi:MAG: hypothetical protein ACE5J7_00150 [Candidatus Aenigmatarchaeota archaeon]